MKPPVFFISTGRTGTRYFARLFARYCTDSAAFHTSPFTRSINILGNMSQQGLLPGQVPGFAWKLIKYGKIRSSRRRYIECNPYYYWIVGTIRSLFPEARLVVIVRSPRSFILSHMRWERQRWKSLAANRLIPFWQPVSIMEQLSCIRGGHYGRVAFYSMVWARKNAVIIDQIAGHKYLKILKFEDLFRPSSGLRIISELMDWLEIRLSGPLDERMITTRVNVSEHAVIEWDENCSRIVKSHCAELIDRFGYGNDL